MSELPRLTKFMPAKVFVPLKLPVTKQFPNPSTAIPEPLWLVPLSAPRAHNKFPSPSNLAAKMAGFPRGKLFVRYTPPMTKFVERDEPVTKQLPWESTAIARARSSSAPPMPLAQAIAPDGLNFAMKMSYGRLALRLTLVMRCPLPNEMFVELKYPAT